MLDLLIYGVVALLQKIPLRPRLLLGKLGGALFSFLPTKDRRVAVLQYQWIMGKPASVATIAQLYANMGQSILETLNLNPLLENHQRYVSCPDWNMLFDLKKSGRPVVALTAHLGNWDLLAAYTVRRGYPLATVGREARLPALQQVLKRLRERYSITTLWRGQSSSDRGAIKELLRCLKQGELVAALVDQDTAVASTFVPFFKHNAKTPSTLVEMALRQDAVIISAFLVRTGFLKYEIELSELPRLSSTEEVLAEFNHRLSQILLKYPTQWVWFHKRWRSSASGERMSTREYIRFLQGELNPQTTRDYYAVGNLEKE